MADTNVCIGEGYRHLGALEKAMFHYNMALSIYIPAVGSSHVSVATTKYNIAPVYRKQGNNIQARTLFQEAAAVFTTVYGPYYGANHRHTTAALNQAQQ